MKAVTTTNGEVVVTDQPEPIPGPGEVLVQVHSAGLNGADIAQSRGLYPPPPGVANPEILGMEFSGELLEYGPGTACRFKRGDRVMAIVPTGAQAELAVVDARMLMRVPEGLDMISAGGIPEVFTTAHDAVFSQAGLRAGEHLLVHGGAGGVGTAAVQLGRAAGARVTATVRSLEHREAVAGLGATVLDPDEFAGAGPYDVILELVGGPNMPANLESLAVGGRIALIGIGGGAKFELNLAQLLFKRGRIQGSTLRPRPIECKALTARAMERDVLPLFERGELTVPVAAGYALDDAAAAYARFVTGNKLGKIILTI